MSQIFSQWHRVRIYFGEHELALKLRALPKGESRDFLRRCITWGKETHARAVAQLEATKKGEEYTAAEDVFDLFERIWGDERARALFVRAVRPDGDLEIDGVKIPDGGALYDELSNHQVAGILGHLERICALSGSEGKASPSGSTSAAETSGDTAPSSVSPASSTASVDGPTA